MKGLTPFHSFRYIRMNKSTSHILRLFILLLFTKSITTYLVSSLFTEDILLQNYLEIFDEATAIALVEGAAESKRALYFTILGQMIATSVKVCGIVFILSIGFFVVKVNYSLRENFGLVVPIYFVYLIPDIVKFVWFTFLGSYNFSDLNSFAPFTFGIFLDVFKLSEWGSLRRFFSSFSFIDILFCLILAYQFSEMKGIKFKSSCIWIFGTYFGALTILAILKVLVINSLTL